MYQDIIFTNAFGTDDIFPPEPASKNIPQWYKDTDSYLNNEKKPSGDGQTTATIKRCMPVFDSMSAGYIIKSQVDVFISQREVKNLADESNSEKITQPWYEWPTFEALGFHPIEQASMYPNNTGHLFTYPKWNNPWSIKTPPGYSCFFTQPLHRSSIFTILPGIVDTDQYYSPVNFPFVLNDPKWEGLIPAGTPIAQIIPFKRDSWNMKLGNQQDFNNQIKVTNKLRTRFFDSYKNQFRQNKEYK